MPPKSIDLLWLVEHVARELDVACAVKEILDREFDLGVEVKQIYFDSRDSLQGFEPKVVVHPFFYALEYPNEPYVRRWPKAVHFNASWEQIFYPGVKKSKAPRDPFSRGVVIHHTWGKFSSDFLKSHQVPAARIFENGNPAMQLYRLPYRNRYPAREILAKRYRLNPHDRWIFVPENYRWAFNSDREIRYKRSAGGDVTEMTMMRDYCRDSLKTLLTWCHKIAEREGVTVIFRPKPATPTSVMLKFFNEFVSKQLSRGLHFHKEESVREWILAADVTTSSFSTTLIEAAVAGKPAFMVEPLPLPPALENDWYEFIDQVRNYEEFERMCVETSTALSSARLKIWAEQTMLPIADPISGLARFLAGLIAHKDQATHNIAELIPPKKEVPLISRYRLAQIKESVVQACGTYSRRLLGIDFGQDRGHENDSFGDDDVRMSVDGWRAVQRSNLHR